MRERMVEKSSYETLREENIKRNAQFLESLGLDAVKPKKFKVGTIPDGIDALKKGKRNTKGRKYMGGNAAVAPAVPTRRSSRIQSHENSTTDGKNEHSTDIAKEKSRQSQDYQGENDCEEEEVYYIHGIEDPNELDGFERAIYDQILRPWRHQLCKELEVEPYKIFRNRTLVEFIRRKRNDRSFAVCSGSGSFEKICSDLSECWGVGPASLREDGGFAHLMLSQIDNQEAEDLFHKSRLLSATSATIVDHKEYKYSEDSGELYDQDEPHVYIGVLDDICSNRKSTIKE